jgi:hypothetical protein
MKFNREQLEELTLQKIKEVNDEAGYRSYLEVPEMVNIVASIMEDKFRVEYDDLVNQIHLLSKELDKAQIKAENLEEENKKWEACADNLIGYAEIIQKTGKSQSTKHYSPIFKDIEKYEKLKNETQSHE